MKLIRLIPVLGAIAVAAVPIRAQADGTHNAAPWIAATAAQAEPNNEAQTQRYVTTDFSLRQVDIGRLVQRLNRLGINIPFAVDGLVTANIEIGVPWTALGTARRYRLDGTLESDRLVVAGVEVRDVDATLVYRDGVLRLTQLQFRIPEENEPQPPPQPEQAPGRFVGSAAMELVPPGNFTADLTLDRIPLEPLARQLPDLPEIAGGRVSGTLTGSAPVNRLRDLSTWEAQGEATVSGLQAYGITLDSAAAKFTLDDALLTMSDLEGRLGEDLRFAGEGTLSLAAPYQHTADVTLSVERLSALKPFAPDLPWPEQVGGTLSLTANESGTLEPFAYQAAGKLSAAEIKVGAVEVASLTADYTATADAIRITDLNASLYEGQLTGTASAPLEPTGLLQADLRWRGIDFGPLIADLEFLPVAADEIDGGEFAGTLTGSIPIEQWQNPALWEVTAAATVTGAEAGELDLQTVRVELRIEDGTLAVPVVRAQLADADVEGTARAGLTAPYPFTADLQLTEFLLDYASRLPESLQPPVPVAGRINLMADVEGTLQPLRITGEGVVSAANLALAGLRADRASFLWAADGDLLRLRDLDVRLYGGAATGTASVPLAETVAGEVDLSWRGINLAPVAEGLVQQLPAGFVPENLAGILAGQLDLTIPAGQAMNWRQWEGNANVMLANAQAWGWDIRNLVAEMRLADQALTLTNLNGDLADGQLTASASIQLAAPYQYAADLRLAGQKLEPFAIGTGQQQLPAQIAGPYELQLDAEGTLQPLRVEGNGTMSADDLVVGEIVADSVRARFEADGRTLDLTELDAQIVGGDVTGSAVIPLNEQVAGSAELRWDDLRLGPLADTLDGLLEGLPEISEQRVTGLLSGEMDATIPAGMLYEPQRWQVNAQAELTQGQIWGWTIERFAATAELRDRTLSLTNVEGDLLETTLTGSGRLSLDAPYTYAAELRIEDGDLANFNALPPPFELPVTVAGEFRLGADIQGTIDPLRVRGDGEIAARDVALARLMIPRLDLDWTAQGDQLQVTNFDAQLAGGEATGEATLPLVPEAAGSAEVRWERVDIGQVASLLDDVPVEVAGNVAGTLSAAVTAAGPDGRRAISAESSITSPELQLGPLDVSDLDGTVALADETIRYNFDGKTLDGTFAAEGTLDLQELTEQTDAGTLKLQSISLSALSRALGLEQTAGPVAGTFDASVAFEHTAIDGLPAGSGTFQLTALRWNDQLVTERVQGQLFLRGMRVFLEGITGRFAQGDLRASVAANLTDLDRTVITLALRGAETAALAGFLPDLPLPLEGTFDLQLRGSLGPRWRAVGTLALPRGRFNTIRLDAMRLPIVLSYDPQTGIAVAQMRDSVVQVAGGRVTGTLRATWGRDLNVEADLNFARLDLQEVLRQLGTQSRFGRGRISGSLTLEGRNVRGLGDLSGRIDADLENIEPRSVPIVASVLPYLTAGVSAYSRIDRGELHAVLSGGVLRVQEFTLDGSALQLYADGTVSETGRLNLEVVANTNALGTNRFAAQVLLERIPPVGPPPVVAIIQANRIVSNRVIYLHVSGTIQRPVVRIRPVPQLKQQVLRFFLSQAAAG